MYHYYYYHPHHHHGHHHYESVMRDRKIDNARVEYSADYSCLLGISQEDFASFSMTFISWSFPRLSSYIFGDETTAVRIT